MTYLPGDVFEQGVTQLQSLHYLLPQSLAVRLTFQLESLRKIAADIIDSASVAEPIREAF